MRLISFYLSYVIFFACSLNAEAQDHQLKGLILDASNGDPLPGAQVFINQTTIGTVSNDLGSFTLKRIPGGSQTVIIRMLGYQLFAFDAQFPDPDLKTIEVSLEPEIMEMEEVSVVDRRPKEWIRNLQYFKDQFFGSSSNADNVSIINPEVLDFQNAEGVFIATARAPLKIINSALGYEIIYYLEKFSYGSNVIRSNGFSKFKEIKASGTGQKELWDRNRQLAYRGSYRHFIESLFKDNFFEEGYRLYYTNRKLKFYSSRYDDMILEQIHTVNEILKPTSNIYESELQNQSGYPFIRVEYIRERPDPKIADRYKLGSQINSQISWIEFPQGKALIDRKSNQEIDPFRALLHGYWGWSSRLPELLPADYRW